MDKIMEAAIVEANATRPRTSHTRTLADARLAYRVRQVEIREEYEAAVARAEGNAGRALLAAERSLATARARARDVAVRRKAAYYRNRYAETADVVRLYRFLELNLKPNAAAYTDPGERTELVCQFRMLGTLLASRGIEMGSL